MRIFDFNDTSVLCAKLTEFDLRGADDYVKCVSVTTVWRVLRLRMEEIGFSHGAVSTYIE